jgi:hypothetical protein
VCDNIATRKKSCELSEWTSRFPPSSSRGGPATSRRSLYLLLQVEREDSELFSQIDFAAALYLSRARTQFRFADGQLYTPAEVAEISANRGHLLQPTWYLGGSVHPEMFEKARWDTSFLHYADIRRSRAGLLYAVFGQRLDTWEHRFLVQLLGDEARQFIQEAAAGPLGITLGDATGPMALALNGPADMRPELPCGAAIADVPKPGWPPKIPHLWPPQTPPPELIGRGL